MKYISIIKFIDTMTTISYTIIQINKLNELLDLLSSQETSTRFMKRLIYHTLIQTGLISHNNDYFIYHEQNIIIKNIIIFTRKIYDIYHTCFYPTSSILSKQYDYELNHPTLYEKLIHVCEPLIWILKFRLQLIESIENCYDKKLESITYCIRMLNNHKYCTKLFNNKEQQKLVLSKIQCYKEQLKSIAEEFNIDLTKNIKIELSRSERIYQILKVENQMEESVSLNIKLVIQNSDLNRYLMEFIE